MTGAEIVRREAGATVVLELQGCFDGASAWELRNAMDASEALDHVVDLGGAVEVCDFAACLLAAWARSNRNLKRVRFRTGRPDHQRLLAAHGLERCEEDETPLAPAPGPRGSPPPRLRSVPTPAASLSRSLV